MHTEVAMDNSTIKYFELVKLRKERTALNYKMERGLFTKTSKRVSIEARLIHIDKLINQNIEESRR